MRIATCGALAMLMGAVACGGGSPASPSPPAGSDGPTAEVRIVGDAYGPGGSASFTPVGLIVAPGTTVIWNNQDQGAHTVTSDTGAFSGSVPGSGSYERAFPTAGDFPYHCAIHAGMSGLVTVR